MRTRYDIVVVGAGHAGCEAAFAASRMGARVLLVTLRLDHVALMSCNPSVGGLAKGHLVREIDALGGIMGRATDETGIQFRMLNLSKGPAVRAPRAQSDKAAYAAWMRAFLARVPGLDLIEGEVETVRWESDGDRPAVRGVRLVSGDEIACRAVIVTTGTFLDGVIHIGNVQHRAGRAGDPSADFLSTSLRELGLATGRLKTGTPPRLEGRTIDWQRLSVQWGDTPEPLFSYSSRAPRLRQVPCHVTFTTSATHDIIRDNLDRSAMYGGHIEGVGPRYCPSIEDKCVRFADKERHQLFLEPEGLDTTEIYVNGISTSLPEDAQRAFVATIPGLERATMLRPGYAIEYTFVPTAQVGRSLEVRAAQGIFLAGQINGTTGYEEAAAQGLMAGINAVLALRGEEPFVLRRDEAYIGVLIDDLVTKEHREPYRMFTSRAEYRLLLRQDNADLRLADHARRLGLIEPARYDRIARLRDGIARERARLDETALRPGTLPPDLAEELELVGLAQPLPLSQFLARPAAAYADLRRLGCDDPALRAECAPDAEEAAVRERIVAQTELACKYAGYIARQEAQVARLARHENLRLPAAWDYAGLTGLRAEAAQKLGALRPETLGQASRIAGVNPADLSVLMIHLKAREERCAPRT